MKSLYNLIYSNYLLNFFLFFGCTTNKKYPPPPAPNNLPPIAPEFNAVLYISSKSNEETL